MESFTCASWERLPFSCQCAARLWPWQALTRTSLLYNSLFPAVSLCLFSAHPQPMLLGFRPANLAFCLARNWDRSESTQDQLLPHPSSPHFPEFTFNWWRWTFGQDNYFIPRWEWWGWGQQDQECQEGCASNMGSNFRGSSLPVELGGVKHSQSKEAVTGRWKMCRLFPTYLSRLLCCKLAAPHGAYTSPLWVCRSCGLRRQTQMSRWPWMQWAFGRASVQLIKNDLCLLLFLLTFNKE